ncbi:hypothetical protein IWZ00DRAFT_445483 [Phyllosticta capitalensis]
MARSATPESSRVREGGIRKRMRKGTHSCFECRRRKIKCIYNENSTTCTECFARGSRCIDQENAESDTVVDNRKNLRERVANLEALVEALLEDKSTTHAAEALRALGKDITITPPESDGPSRVHEPEKDTAPFLSMFNNELRRAEGRSNKSCSDHPLNAGTEAPTGPANEAGVYDIEFTGIGAPPPASSGDNMNGARKSKAKRTRDTLLAALPSNEKLESAINTNDDWWRLWRYKIPGIARGDNLQEFASRVIEKGSPPEVGVLLLCVGVALDSDDLDSQLALIDALIVSDDEYAATLQGLECIILMSKCYSEIGQPRRGWIAVRKGLAYAQILGLHRSHTTSPEWNAIWWSLYTTDRFLSLLLGLPYGISDSHCDLTMLPTDGEGDELREATGKLAVLAGKVIDRTQSVGDLSFSSALELDDELDAITSDLPENWNETELPLSGSSPDCQKLVNVRERFLMHICAHQLRMYLHLPFMLKLASSSSSPTGCSKFEYSRTACFGASRRLLEVYRALRTGNGQPLYECKVIDFVGFTAAVLLFLGLLGYRRLDSKTGDASAQAAQDENDWRIIEITMDIFQRASTERGGKVAEQSLRVLQQLSKVRNMTMSGEDISYSERVAIPYFGTISVQRGKKFHHVAKSNNTSPVATNCDAQQSPSQQQNAMPPPATATGGPDAFDATPVFPGAPASFPQNAARTPSNSTISTPPNPMISYDPYVPSTGQWFFPGAAAGNMLHHGVGNAMNIASTQNLAAGMGSGVGGSGGAAWGGEDGLDNLVGGANAGIGAPWMNSNLGGLGAGAMDLDQDWAWFWGGTTSEVSPST